MKRTKFFAGAAALVFVMSLGLASCSNDSNDNSNTEASEEEQELEASAFSVLRSLTDLAKYDPEAVKEDEDDEYIGVETLPSNWKSMTFACDQGTALSSDSTVRVIAANGIDDAKDFFASMIGEEFTSDTYSWSYAGLGSLTFTAVSGDDDLFATIDVSIDVLPDVTQLRFLSEEAYEEATAELNAENSFSGVPYYSAGDVIQRTSDGTYWICVRPAGGPLYKDKSYWICLSPFDKSGKSIIKTETKTQTTYWDDDGQVLDGGNKFTSKWTYAKNLMTLKTAKAAHHTFNAIVNPLAQELCKTENLLDEKLIYDSLSEKGFDLLNLHRSYPCEEDEGKDAADEYTNKKGNFNFAYGSPKKDSKRVTSGKNKNADVNYVQPFIQALSTVIENGKVKEEICTKWTQYDYGGGVVQLPFLPSLTDTYDDNFLAIALDDVTGGKKETYDCTYFLHRYTEGEGMNFVDSDKTWHPLLKQHVILSPELCIKDNKGAGTKPSSAYKDIYTSGMVNWWWDSLYRTVRYVDTKAVEWNDENK